MSENNGQRPQRQRNIGSQEETFINIVDNDENSEDELEVYLKERKKKITKVVITIILTILLLIGIFTGYYFLSTGLNDSRVLKLNEQVATLEETIKSKDSKISELRKAVEDTTVKEVVPETSLQRIEGSEVPEFWLIEGDFIAPNKLEIPTVSDDVNNSNIQIGSSFKFKPSENWLIAIKGTTVEFSHPTKIWGKIKALTHKDRVQEVDMKETIQNFFIGYPSTTISYRKVFMGDYVAGYMGKAEITVKDTETGIEKVMILNIGFAQRGDYTISFMFANDKESVVAQELIDLFLKSITFGEVSLKLE